MLNRQTVKNVTIPLIPGEMKASIIDANMLQVARRGESEYKRRVGRRRGSCPWSQGSTKLRAQTVLSRPVTSRVQSGQAGVTGQCFKKATAFRWENGSVQAIAISMGPRDQRA